MSADLSPAGEIPAETFVSVARRRVGRGCVGLCVLGVIVTVYARGPLQAVATEVGPDIGSDHRPVKTVWRWENPE